MAQKTPNSPDPDDFVESQLEDALASDSPSKKDYHMRQALQALELA